MHDLLEQAGALTDWPEFAATWNDLGPDTYMADGGRYRKRRHAVFAVSGEWDCSPTGPATFPKPRLQHAERRDRAMVRAGDRAGGVQRKFDDGADVLPDLVRDGKPRARLARRGASVPYRGAARGGWPADTRGLHRDGVDYVLVLLVNRTNIASGMTSVHDLAGTQLGEFTLTQPLDAALVDDARVLHGVTPVEPLDPATPGYRDVLVVTFRRG